MYGRAHDVSHKELLSGHAKKVPYRHGDGTKQVLPQAVEPKFSEEQGMKRFHVHIAVDDLAANIRFYSSIFGIPPTIEKSDYAKQMIDAPRINFAITTRDRDAWLDHFRVQVESHHKA